MDGTITDSGIGCPEIGFFELILRDLLAERNGSPLDEALKEVITLESLVPGQDPFLALNRHDVGVTAENLWCRIMEERDKYIFPYTDAIGMIEHLQQDGYKLYTASNISRSRILAVLGAIGISSSLQGSPCFIEAYGRDLTGCMKDTPEFYRHLLKRENLNGAETVMIGDSVKDDYLTAKAAGINRSIIVNRQQEAAVIKESGVCYISSLASVPAIIKGWN